MRPKMTTDSPCLSMGASKLATNGRVRTDRLGVSSTDYLLNADPWQGDGAVEQLVLVLMLEMVVLDASFVAEAP